MAKFLNLGKEAPSEPPQAPTFTEQDKAKARAWFKKAEAERDRRAYDYAIECYVTGLGFWPEAVEEGHMPLWSLAVQRVQAGGKKPGMMETLKHPSGVKNARQAMLNAELLMAKDIQNPAHYEALLKAAVRGPYLATLKWAAPRALDVLRKEKKPSAARFKAFKQILVEGAERADQLSDPQTAAFCYEQALQSVEFLMARNPTDMSLRDEQRDLSGRLTITKGKYNEADSFRESLVDADKQKLLHDAERVKQGELTLRELVAAARQAWRDDPTEPGKIAAYVDVLLKSEQKADEDEAIDVLTEAYKKSNNYRFKLRADDIRLRQLARQRRELRDAAAAGSEDDKQQYRLALLEERQVTIEILRERVQEYPTDLQFKYKLGAALFQAGELDEAIPVLQVAQADPRTRFRCLLLIGQAFARKGAPRQAIDVLKEAIEAYAGGSDDLAKELLYSLATAYLADHNPEEAKSVLGRLLRIDYNYANGKARQLLEELQ